MADTVFNLQLYTIQSNEILRNRRAFYGLLRRSEDKTTAWLKQVKNCIRRCEYPKIIMEFLLFDRFICELNDNELTSMESVNKSWTLQQLLEHFYGTGHIETVSAVVDIAKQNENTVLDSVKSEPVCICHVKIICFHEKSTFFNILFI